MQIDQRQEKSLLVQRSSEESHWVFYNIFAIISFARVWRQMQTKNRGEKKVGDKVYISTSLEAYLNICLPHEVLFFSVIDKKRKKSQWY